jgi:putative glycosyltransferase (TIGR04348 family)
VVIVSPALAGANNGNWQTARRWQLMLASRFPVRIAGSWPDGEAASNDRFMLALHARRSAPAIQAWSQARPGRGLAVVLTGTDLYQDIHHDAAAARSLALAQRLVVLQELAPRALPQEFRDKARVIFQSTGARKPLEKSSRFLRALMVGHLRAVKSPQTLFEAARLLRFEPGMHIDHVGDASEAALGIMARATGRECLHYRWLGAQPHEATLRRIQRAHLLVHTSALEGGAHVVMEAVRSGTPVLASRVDGNVGMLGPDYEGYFPHGDAQALAALLRQCRAEQERAQSPSLSLLGRLGAQCRERAPLFDPATERAALLGLLNELE